VTKGRIAPSVRSMTHYAIILVVYTHNYNAT